MTRAPAVGERLGVARVGDPTRHRRPAWSARWEWRPMLTAAAVSRMRGPWHRGRVLQAMGRDVGPM